MIISDRPKILAVDDKPELLTAIQTMLYEEYTLICVTSAKAALSAIEVHTPNLFILDILMPVTSGIQLAQQLRSIKRFEKTPIIFLTGMNTREDVTSAIVNGGNDYILKPVDKDLLLSKVRKYL